MKHILSENQIEVLWDALRAEARPTRPWQARSLLRKLVGTGWASRADIEDVFFYQEPRLDQHGLDIVALGKAFGLPWRSVYNRPRARSNSVWGVEMLSATDVAALLIGLERLGFRTDASPLVDALRPSILKQDQVSSEELSILWFDRVRHRGAALTVQVDDRAAGCTDIQTFKAVTGYKAELWLDSENKPLLLSVDAPKFRRRPKPVKTDCPICGATWYRGDPDSSAGHRREHRRRMAYLDPQPHRHLARLNGTDRELVVTASPAWKHREMWERAIAFKREMGFDFAQWGSPKGDDDPHVHGFLFSDEKGSIVGACAFRLRERPKGNRWGLQWVWVCPRARRSGVLTKRWPLFREKFGQFHVEGPVSEAMVSFVKRQGDEALLGPLPSR